MQETLAVKTAPKQIQPGFLAVMDERDMNALHGAMQPTHSSSCCFWLARLRQAGRLAVGAAIQSQSPWRRSQPRITGCTLTPAPGHTWSCLAPLSARLPLNHSGGTGLSVYNGDRGTLEMKEKREKPRCKPIFVRSKGRH